MASELPRARWYYFLPHDEEATFKWEDVYLLPDFEGWNDGSLWLTVNALGAVEEADDPDFRQRLEAKMGAADYFLDHERLDMFIRAEYLTIDSLRSWVTVALRDIGLPCDELLAGTREMFAGTNKHARIVAEALRMTEDADRLCTDRDDVE